MFLIWSEGLNSEWETQSPSAVGELVNSLSRKRLLRVRGLGTILNFLRIRIRIRLRLSHQTLLLHSVHPGPDLQLQVLFQQSLKRVRGAESRDFLDHIFTVDPMKITTPSTDAEVALALRVRLLHRESTVFAHQHKAILQDFEASNGVGEVVVLITDNQVDDNPRCKCGEFFLLLIGDVNGKERSPMTAINNDIRRLLGENSSSLMWAASQFGLTLDPDQRLMALHIQPRRVLESLDLY